VVKLRKKQWGTTPRRQKRRDVNVVYCLGVHNRGGGNPLITNEIKYYPDEHHYTA